MENYLTIFINGKPFNCEHSMTLRNILSYLNFNIKNIIIEYNKEIINEIYFDSLILKNHDHLEIITIVGGG
uniref:Thiamin biosynthesis protein S n=1 Tax=Sonderella linearis TaxID=110477 RepID=A0A1Z1MMY3_9FLOR|nr:thiamin biosynthesis protein S [Sonderella linearis]ARW67124.1 thiamin biosynthesis protein S [Sonderella linearis]